MFLDKKRRRDRRVLTGLVDLDREIFRWTPRNVKEDGSMDVYRLISLIESDLSLTTRELADLLGCCRSTVASWDSRVK